jgi:hypothetical protein
MRNVMSISFTLAKDGMLEKPVTSGALSYSHFLFEKKVNQDDRDNQVMQQKCKVKSNSDFIEVKKD